jgi:hypothetical protein
MARELFLDRGVFVLFVLNRILPAQDQFERSLAESALRNSLASVLIGASSSAGPNLSRAPSGTSLSFRLLFQLYCLGFCFHQCSSVFIRGSKDFISPFR